eukprot:TRINITY_DN25485_c0_g1_i1.p1 TRINITY_DN25485_c0_g1~~TRINITY_DN25485_c0_g1_i1.p1  ORF type:complete len:111 (-),score=4.22 TRINITY_DN25485_c0_g1_i1:193-525(-)
MVVHLRKMNRIRGGVGLILPTRITLVSSPLSHVFSQLHRHNPTHTYYRQPINTLSPAIDFLSLSIPLLLFFIWAPPNNNTNTTATTPIPTTITTTAYTRFPESFLYALLG